MEHCGDQPAMNYYIGRSGYGTRTQLTAVCIQKSYEFCIFLCSAAALCVVYILLCIERIDVNMYAWYHLYMEKNCFFSLYEMCYNWGWIHVRV